MKVKEIRYAMVRVTKAYENDRVEFRLEVEDGDDVGQVARAAKELCEKALKTNTKGL